MKVTIHWNSDAADAQGHKTEFGGIDWVCERPDGLILVTEDGTPEDPPRIVVPGESIAFWHETVDD